MSTKQKIQIKFKQRIKRHKMRLKLLKMGLNPDEYFYGKYLVKELPQEKKDVTG